MGPIEAAAMAVADDDKNWSSFHEDYRAQCRKVALRVIGAYLKACVASVLRHGGN